MPTQNRRVATYLPNELGDRLKAFITERNLKGDSAALIVILTEYFGVSQQVAQKVDYSEFVKFSQLQEILDKVSQSRLNSELLNSLVEKIKSLEKRLEGLEASTLSSFANSSGSSPHNGSAEQMDLLTVIDSTLGDSPSSLKSEPLDIALLHPLTGSELALRFQLDKGAPSKEKGRMTPERFLEWTREKDPDNIAWEYDKSSKRYTPIIGSLPRAETSNQVSPVAPQGSERSEEG